MALAFLRWIFRLLTVLIVSHSVCVILYYTPDTHSSREAMTDALQRLHCANLRRKFSVITSVKSTSQDVDVKLKVVTDDRVSITYCSPGEMRLQLEVDENEDISVCEVKDLQLKMNRNDSISELKSPTLVSKDLSDPAGASGEEANDQGDLDAEENRPAECSAGQMTKNISTVFQRFRAGFQRKMPNSDGEPEVDLIDPEDFFVSDPSDTKFTWLITNNRVSLKLICLCLLKLNWIWLIQRNHASAQKNNVMKIKKVHGFIMTKRTEYATVRNIKKIRTFIQNDRPKHVGVSAWPEMNQSVPEPEPEEDPDDPPENEWDLAAPEESCEPGPSAPEPESKVVSALTRLENYVPLNMFQLEDRLKKCTPLRQRHVTNVWPRIFIGDGEIATDRGALQEMCITHILNAAAQKKDLKYYLGTFNDEDVVGSVNTRSRYYRGLHINYYSLPTADRHCSDISEYFMPAAKFIDKALDK